MEQQSAESTAKSGGQIAYNLLNIGKVSTDMKVNLGGARKFSMKSLTYLYEVAYTCE